MKSIVVEGDKTEGPCETCGGFVPAVWKYLPWKLSDGRTVDDVMQAVCASCGAIVAIADQSAHLVREALDDRVAHRIKIRLPQELMDFASIELSATGQSPTAYEWFWRALFRVCLDEGSKILSGLVQTVHDSVLDAPMRVSVNISLTEHVDKVLAEVCEQTGMDVSKVVRTLMVLADGELQDRVRHAIRQMALVPA